MLVSKELWDHMTYHFNFESTLLILTRLMLSITTLMLKLIDDAFLDTHDFDYET